MIRRLLLAVLFLVWLLLTVGASAAGFFIVNEVAPPLPSATPVPHFYHHHHLPPPRVRSRRWRLAVIGSAPRSKARSRGPRSSKNLSIQTRVRLKAPISSRCRKARRFRSSPWRSAASRWKPNFWRPTRRAQFMRTSCGDRRIRRCWNTRGATCFGCGSSRSKPAGARRSASPIRNCCELTTGFSLTPARWRLSIFPRNRFRASA